ncbi:MAG: glycoside hydrolase family 97 N-terminal domain-containing protein, partial [Bacteroidetes bacterium]|nr:glycoside hydrolase family 97 N-terminal domain-containing protein [Bacteroidota bacterium]
MLRFIAVLLLFVLAQPDAFAQTIQSPNKVLTLTFALTRDGTPTYRLWRGDKVVIALSKMGLTLKDQPSLTEGFRFAGGEQIKRDERWEPVWGERSLIRNAHTELRVRLEQPEQNGRMMHIVFRLFDDGLGFRYEFPEQDNLRYFTVSDERTEFKLTGDHKAWWIPGDFDTNEYSYSESKLSEVNADIGKNVGEIYSKSVLGPNFVQTPLMMKSAEGLYINVFEAALVNYPAMAVEIDKATFTLRSVLAPDAVGNKAYMQTPCRTPWRTIIVSDKATEILVSSIILNLNEPSVIEGASAWIKPMKYVGIWWEMHVGTATWNYAD